MRLKKRPCEEYSEKDKLIHQMSVRCRQEAKQVLRFELQKAIRSERKKGKEVDDLNTIKSIADIKAITPDSVSKWCLHRMGLVRCDVPLEGTEKIVVNNILKHQRLVKVMREFQPRISRLHQPPNKEKAPPPKKGVVGHYGPAVNQTKRTEQQVHTASKPRHQPQICVISNAAKTYNTNKPQFHERQRSRKALQKANKAQAEGRYEDSDVKKAIHGSWVAKQALKKRETLDLKATAMGKKIKFTEYDDEQT